jgi:ribosomal protein S18 acetylase RimI-like enzyme
MCEHSQAQALAMGFRAMQFNLVVATNARAIRLWERLGFAVVGRLPGAFNHQQLGYVDALVMFKTLVAGNSPGRRTP